MGRLGRGQHRGLGCLFMDVKLIAGIRISWLDPSEVQISQTPFWTRVMEAGLVASAMDIRDIIPLTENDKDC